MLLYLEDLDAAAIGEIMEMSAVTCEARFIGIKAILARRFMWEDNRDGETPRMIQG